MRAHLAAAIAGFFLATTLHAQFHDIPNDIKYRDTSRPHARGRSGSAAIEARALLGSDGTTELVVTTGSLDPAAAGPGNIDKVQLKLAAGDAARNFNGLNGGGAFATTLTGLGRGHALQIQANVSGIDASRTDVVTVSEVVKLRPDLAVERIVMQPHTAIGVPLQVSALLRERNGDVGARADCVLYADGVEADRANRIWIDANGTVTCQFLHTFATEGTHELRVALANVAPGDYDDANNSAAAPVQVYASVSEFPQWYAGAGDESWDSHYVSSGASQEMDTHDTGWSRMTNFNVNMPDQEESWPTLRVSYQESTDGTTAVDIADAQWTTSGNCSVALEQDTTIEKCLLLPGGGHGPNFPILQIRVSRGGGGATFRSHGWYLAYDWASGRWDRYTVNGESTFSYGTEIQLGNTVAMTVRASDGTNFWEAQPFMNLTSTEVRYDQPYRCYTDWNGNQLCSSSTYRRVGRVGYDGGGF